MNCLLLLYRIMGSLNWSSGIRRRVVWYTYTKHHCHNINFPDNSSMICASDWGKQMIMYEMNKQMLLRLMPMQHESLLFKIWFNENEEVRGKTKIMA